MDARQVPPQFSPGNQGANVHFSRPRVRSPMRDWTPQRTSADEASAQFSGDHRLSRNSSLYNDASEWNNRISRLSMPREWQPLEDYEEPSTGRVTFANEPHQHNGIVPVKHADESVLEKALTADSTSSLEVGRDLRSRNVCAMALILGIMVGIASLAIGIEIVASGDVLLPDFLRGKFMTMGTIDYPFTVAGAVHYLTGHRVISVPPEAMYCIGIALNICLTILFDCMAFIQNTTLRWALCKEGRLVFNSNPRLLTGARNFAPNWRLTNAVSCLAMIMGYGSISVLTCSIYIFGMVNAKGRLDKTAPVTGPRYAIDFNAWGFIGLGVALLLQGTISAWCLAKSKIVPTWSSNPFNTALVCAILGLVEKNKLHSQKLPSTDAIVSPSDSSPRNGSQTFLSKPSSRGQGLLLTTPLPKQPSMHIEAPRCRRFTYVIWGVCAFVVLWILLVAIFGTRTGACTREYVEQMNYRADFLAYWQSYCQIGISYYRNAYQDRRDWLGLIIQCLALAPFTFGIHCAELLTDMARDESAWRKASTTGADAGRGALLEGSTSWFCWLMFAFKSLTPWMFGMAFNTNLFVFSNLIPLSVLCLITLLLALLSEYLVRRRPKGPQPCTFGNVAKLACLVDEWHSRIFWGDKGMIDYRIRKAGTAGRRLADLDMAMLYSNLRV